MVNVCDELALKLGLSEQEKDLAKSAVEEVVKRNDGRTFPSEIWTKKKTKELTEEQVNSRKDAAYKRAVTNVYNKIADGNYSTAKNSIIRGKLKTKEGLKDIGNTILFHLGGDQNTYFKSAIGNMIKALPDVKLFDVKIGSDEYKKVEQAAKDFINTQALETGDPQISASDRLGSINIDKLYNVIRKDGIFPTSGSITARSLNISRIAKHITSLLDESALTQKALKIDTEGVHENNLSFVTDQLRLFNDGKHSQLFNDSYYWKISDEAKFADFATTYMDDSSKGIVNTVQQLSKRHARVKAFGSYTFGKDDLKKISDATESKIQRDRVLSIYKLNNEFLNVPTSYAQSKTIKYLDKFTSLAIVPKAIGWTINQLGDRAFQLENFNHLVNGKDAGTQSITFFHDLGRMVKGTPKALSSLVDKSIQVEVHANAAFIQESSTSFSYGIGQSLGIGDNFSKVFNVVPKILHSLDIAHEKAMRVRIGNVIATLGNIPPGLLHTMERLGFTKNDIDELKSMLLKQKPTERSLEYEDLTGAIRDKVGRLHYEMNEFAIPKSAKDIPRILSNLIDTGRNPLLAKIVGSMWHFGLRVFFSGYKNIQEFSRLSGKGGAGQAIDIGVWALRYSILQTPSILISHGLNYVSGQAQGKDSSDEFSLKKIIQDDFYNVLKPLNPVLNTLAPNKFGHSNLVQHPAVSLFHNVESLLSHIDDDKAGSKAANLFESIIPIPGIGALHTYN